MNMFFFRTRDMVSPWMLVTSALLHGVLLFVIAVAAFPVHNTIKLKNEAVNKVKLVEPAPGPPALEKVIRGPVREPSSTVEGYSEAETSHISEPVRERVESRTIASAKADVQLVRRKKALSRIETQKEPNKPKTETAKKKEDPKAVLEERLAAIRKEVERKKLNSESNAPSDPDGRTSGQNGAKGGSDGQELLRWFDMVKEQVNSHWSLFGEIKNRNQYTVIGVKIGESGELLNATIDQSSGDPIFDRSAMRAILQSSPFPPPPEQVRNRIKQAGGLALRFTPKGIQ